MEMGCRTVGHQNHEKSSAMGPTITWQPTAVSGNQTAHFCGIQGSHTFPSWLSHTTSHTMGWATGEVTAAGCSGEHSRGGRMLEVCSGLCSHGTAEAQPSHSETHFYVSDKSLFGQPNQRDRQQFPAMLNTFKYLWMLEVWCPL